MTEDELRARVDRLETALASIAYMRDEDFEDAHRMRQVRQSVRITLRDYIRAHPESVVAA